MLIWMNKRKLGVILPEMLIKIGAYVSIAIIVFMVCELCEGSKYNLTQYTHIHQ